MTNEEILTTCREIYAHKYTFGMGFRKLNKAIKEEKKQAVKEALDKVEKRLKKGLDRVFKEDEREFKRSKDEGHCLTCGYQIALGEVGEIKREITKKK